MKLLEKRNPEYLDTGNDSNINALAENVARILDDKRQATYTDSVRPIDTGDEIGRRSLWPALRALQMQLASVPIVPIPDFCRTVVAAGTNHVEEIRLDGNVQLIMARGANPTAAWWLSFGARVILPPLIGTDDTPRDQLARPDGVYFWTKGCGSISVGIPVLGEAVSVLGWKQI